MKEKKLFVELTFSAIAKPSGATQTITINNLILSLLNHLKVVLRKR